MGEELEGLMKRKSVPCIHMTETPYSVQQNELAEWGGGEGL